MPFAYACITVVLCMTCAITLLVIRRRIGRVRASVRCPYCGHDVRGLRQTMELCPECGKKLFGRIPETRSRRTVAKRVMLIAACLCLLVAGRFALPVMSEVPSRLESVQMRFAGEDQLIARVAQGDRQAYHELTRRLAVYAPTSRDAVALFDAAFAYCEDATAQSKPIRHLSTQAIRDFAQVLDAGAVPHERVEGWHQMFARQRGLPVPNAIVRADHAGTPTLHDVGYLDVPSLASSRYAFWAAPVSVRVTRDGETIGEAVHALQDYEVRVSAWPRFGGGTQHSISHRAINEVVHIPLPALVSPGVITIETTWALFGYDHAQHHPQGVFSPPDVHYTIRTSSTTELNFTRD